MKDLSDIRQHEFHVKTCYEITSYDRMSLVKTCNYRVY